MKSSSAHNASPSVKYYSLILAGILLFGFAIKTAGIGYGLPYPGYFSSDEIDIVARSLKIAGGDLTPTHFNKSCLFNIISVLFYACNYALMLILGTVKSADDFKRIFIQDSTVFYIMPRLLSAIASTFTVFFLAQAVNKIRNGKTALVAAILLTSCFTTNKFSHYAKEDSLLTMFIVLSFYISLLYTENRNVKYLLAAAFVSGLAAAAKYNGILSIFFPITAFIFTINTDIKISRFLLFFLLVILAVFGFSAGMPYFFLHPLKFVRGFFESQIISQVQGQTTWLGGEKHYGMLFILLMLYKEFCAPLLLFIILSAAFVLKGLFRKKDKESGHVMIMSSMFYLFVTFLIYLASGHLDYHYVMPITPFLILSAAIFFETIMNTIKKNHFYILMAVLVIIPLFSSIRFSIEAMGTDPRIEAYFWIGENIQRTDKIAFDTDYYYQYHPPVELCDDSINMLIERSKEKGGSGTYFEMLKKYQSADYTYNTVFLPMPTWITKDVDKEIKCYDIDSLRAQNVKWLITSGAYRDRIMRDKNPGWNEMKKFYTDLDKKSPPQKRFSAKFMKNMGPEICIYKIE